MHSPYLRHLRKIADGSTTHQPLSRILAAFCVQLLYTQLLALVYIELRMVGTEYSHSAAYFEVAVLPGCLL